MASASDWELRYRAPRMTLPMCARDAPARCVYLSNRTGTVEVWAWDREEGNHRQVTRRSTGTLLGALDPSGEWVWWFDDTDGDEFGRWMRQPFRGGKDEPATPSLAPAYPGGLALGGSMAIVGQQSTEGSRIWCVPENGEARLLYRHDDDAEAVALSHDEDLVALAHSEHGDPRHKALRVVDSTGEAVADLWDGAGFALHGVDFAPVAGDRRLLVLHEKGGRPLPMVWDPSTGTEERLEVREPGDVDAQWYADGDALLLRVNHAGRTRLLRTELPGGRTTMLATPAGTVTGATARPDGSVEFAWSSAAEPLTIRSTSGDVVVVPPGPVAPPSVPVRDVWIDGPEGRVHALLSLPDSESESAPYPTIFLVHGGPHMHDADAFVADVATYVDHGFAVVRVNYRGSTGYGAPWRDAIEGRPGLTELEDVAAVRAHLVDSGVADRNQLVLMGGSWGGYLTLLGLGVEPDTWRVGVAAVPVADYVTAYEDEMENLRAFDRALFGGSPEEVPERYRTCSPLTYVSEVVAPVLVLAGENDPRCPIRQIENYLAALRDLGKPHEVYRFDAGHSSLVIDERIAQVRAILDFLHRHLG